MSRRRLVVDELEFPTQYGKLAAKTWGEDSDDCRRVLVLHGWMDNAGSFDNIIPKLKLETGQDFYFVALDFPGHGRSSQLPPGAAYSDLGLVAEVRRCMLQLGWGYPDSGPENGDASPDFVARVSPTLKRRSKAEKAKKRQFTIMGHSLGGGIGLFYASLYPDEIDEIVLLDFIKPKSFPNDLLLQSTAATIDQFIQIASAPATPFSPSAVNKSGVQREADKGQVVVSYETAVIVTVEAHKILGTISRDDACCLLRRSTVSVSSPPNSVIYSRDLRLNAMLNFREHWETGLMMFNNIDCHVICILGKSGMYNGHNEHFELYMDKMEEHLKKRAKTWRKTMVEGDHFFHLNNSATAAEVVNRFMAETPTLEVNEKD